MLLYYRHYSKVILQLRKAVGLHYRLINVKSATYAWTIKDTVGNIVDLSTASKVQNSMTLPAGLLSSDNFYVVELTVTQDTLVGTAQIKYSTMANTHYTFEVEPTSGVAFGTDFIVAAVSQNIDAELTNFAFGYIKGGKEYLLTRSLPKPLHIVKLPQGETSNQLTLFLKIINKQKSTILFMKTVTVSAPSASVNDFYTTLSSTLSDSINESVQVRLQYEYFKDSMTSNKTDALNLILDGLQSDGKLLNKSMSIFNFATI